MDEVRRLKVVFIASDNSGPWFHVQYLPQQYFRKYNLLEPVAANDLHSILNTSDADLVYFQRQYMAEIIMVARRLRSQGKVLVSNVDDDVWNLPDNNPAKGVYTPEVLSRYEILLSEIDATVTSTPYLKKIVLPFNSKCYVERNLVEPFYNEFVAEGRDKDDEGLIRLGWHLTPHHHDDYLLIEKAIDIITKKYPKVKWIFMGYRVPICDKMPPNRWEFYDFVPTQAFYPALASLDIDLGIAPLIDAPFNWGKTHRKFSEYAIMGIPCILSPVLPYLGLDKEGVALIPKTNDTNGWVEMISYAIEHKEEMEQQAIRAYKWVLTNQSIDLWIAERAAILYDIYNKAKGTNYPVPGFENKIWNFQDAEHIQNLVLVPGRNDYVT